MRRILATSFPGEFCTSANAAFALLLCMKQLSREAYHTDWAPHLERQLWKEMHQPNAISEVDASVLRHLSTLSSGWWSWSNQEAGGPTFVSLGTWRESVRQEQRHAGGG